MISRFRGEHRFLSNFGEGGFVGNVDGFLFWFPSNEHWYQANKATTWEDFVYVLEAATPGEARARGNEIVCRPDWELVGETVMLYGLRAKFLAGSFLAHQLLQTGDEELVEGNTHGDTRWGVDARTGHGLNLLGKLLMQVRSELRQKEEEDGKSNHAG